MELVNYNKEQRSLTIKLTDDEFSDIMSMVHSVGVEYDSLDAEILMTPEDRVDAIVKSVYDIAKELETLEAKK